MMGAPVPAIRMALGALHHVTELAALCRADIREGTRPLGSLGSLKGLAAHLYPNVRALRRRGELPSVTAFQYNAISVLMLILALPLGFLGLYVSTGFLYLFILVPFVIGPWRMLVRCPACKNPVGYVRNPAVRLGTWVPAAPERCSQCGHDLTKNSI
jgi:hypothetical protein